MSLEFEKFPKIPRWHNLYMTITEKIDGTNAQIVIPDDEGQPIQAGSRNRWIYPGKGTDNYEFAAWVKDHEIELRRLGPGRHYGEWWGKGIGRHYGREDRTWSLFNVHRYEKDGLPVGCPVTCVPVLYHGPVLSEFGEGNSISLVCDILKGNGSVAARGFMKPEGVVIEFAGVKSKLVFDKAGPSPEEG